jgi:protein required for attachment to host cells
MLLYSIAMNRTCIAIVDASRARLFTLERETDGGPARETLLEVADFVNPARRLKSSELFSDSFAFDDHRDANIDHMDVEFARMVTAETSRVLEASNAKHLIVCASPRMLDKLRTAMPAREGVVVDDLARDFVKLSASELRHQLASCGLLPAIPARPAVRA